MRRRLIGTTVLGMAVAMLAGAGTAGASGKLVADLKLTSHRPNTPTGGTLHLVWPDNAPDGRPKPEAKGVFVLPKGSRINESALPTCTASDEQLKVEGGAACPAGSDVGPGHVSFMTGLGAPVDPFLLDNEWYHGPHQIFGLFTPPGAPAPVIAVNRVKIVGTSFVAAPSLPPGFPPTTKTVPKQSDQRIFKRVSSTGASFITTPPTCPRSHKWISHATVTYDDGSVDRATSVTRCRRR
jgi:hypothetical protein